MGSFYCQYAVLCKDFSCCHFFDNGLPIGSLVFSVIYLVTLQPAFQGLGTSSKLTPLPLETLLTEGSTSRFWLVEFSASCYSACIRASCCFPELSITYSNKNLSFGIVDLGLIPNAAEKFGISLSGGMGQLPTYILFESATEVTRFPEWDFEAKASCPLVTKKVLSKHFELDQHLLEYMSGKYAPEVPRAPSLGHSIRHPGGERSSSTF